MKAILCVLFTALLFMLSGCGGLEKRPSGSAAEYCDGKWVPENGEWVCKHRTAVVIAAPSGCTLPLQPVYTGMLWTCMTPANAAWYGYTWQTYPYAGWYYPSFGVNLNACIHCGRGRWR